MTCTEARDAMLVAELADLRTKATTPLAAHLLDCAECRARAATIASQTAVVGALIARRRGVRRARPVRRFVLVASLPIAAALIVAVTIRRGRDEAVIPRAHPHSLPVARNVSVDVAPGQQTTVLKTADSTVTVIWLTPGVGQ